MPAVVDERLGDVRDLPAAADPKPQVPVAAAAEGLVEEPHPLETSAPHHHRGREDGVSQKQPLEELPAECSRIRPARYGRPDGLPCQGPPVGMDEARLLIGFEQRDLAGKLLRVPPVVGIEKGDVLAVGFLNGPVARGAKTPVGVLHIKDALSEAGGDGRSVIGGAVVDDDDLDVRVGLGEDAFDGLGEIPTVVVAGNDGRDSRHGAP